MLDRYISILLKKNRLIKIAIVVVVVVFFLFYEKIQHAFVPHKIEYKEVLKNCEDNMNYAKLNGMFSSQVKMRNKIGNSIVSLGHYNDYIVSHIEHDGKILYFCLYQSDNKRYIGYTFNKQWDYVVYTTINIDNKKGYKLYLNKVSKERKAEVKAIVTDFVSGRFNVDDYMRPALEEEIGYVGEKQ